MSYCQILETLVFLDLFISHGEEGRIDHVHPIHTHSLIEGNLVTKPSGLAVLTFLSLVTSCPRRFGSSFEFL